MSVRWHSELEAEIKQDSFFQKEIDAALTQEIVAETIVGRIIRKIEENKNTIAKYDYWSEIDDMYNANRSASAHLTLKEGFDHAEKHMNATWAIVSPTILTIMQSHDIGFVRDIWETSVQQRGFSVVGPIGKMRVIVNEYGSDSMPVLIGNENSISPVRLAFGFDVKPLVCPQCFEQTHKFYGDIDFDVDHSQVAKIEIDFGSLGCFI